MAPFCRLTAAAAAGAVALNALCLLQPMPVRSAWGWSSQPLLENAGFRCAPGTGFGCGTAPCPEKSLKCTVVPKWGMKCDHARVQLMCVNNYAPHTEFTPDSKSGPTGCTNRFGMAKLQWQPAISCRPAHVRLVQQNASEGHSISQHGALAEAKAHDTVHLMQQKVEARVEL
eukprot:CAMPEP_0204143180 /NCGR_PEP_ID=MMETSP0361-20130328/20373_1 /ASSEMBLY_ACC=CAM_ASM_000343 /TAXON_ID=268821 /ORGANISM="Scrippsiella Hangoei, Strain SHTV-5" /LENGTH=171 /DNA_ID=CAMNT_0051097035 /DNA_START=68 /DNA_END=583 /DNA_ORIENTATION=-